MVELPARALWGTGAIPPWCLRAVNTEPGGLPICLEMTLIDSPDLHRRHRSAFISSDIPGRPGLATCTVLNQRCCSDWLDLSFRSSLGGCGELGGQILERLP